MVPAESIHQFLASADTLRDPYRTAGTAAALLEANPNDKLAREYYRRALAALRLTAAIERLEAGSPDTSSKRSAGGGLIPWGSRSRRFAANLRALELRSQEASALIADAAPQLTGYELSQCADGNYQVSDAQKPVPASWLGTLANHKAAISMWRFDRTQIPTPAPLAFDGLGFGWLLLHVLETTRNSYLNYSCAVYVLESDPLALAMLFHMHDLQAVIQEGAPGSGMGRIRWFVGHNAETLQQDFKQTLLNRPDFTVPTQFVRCGLRPRAALDPQSIIKSVHEARDAQRKEQLASIRKYYHDKNAVHWHQRIESALSTPGDPLRILGITSRYTTVLQHSMSELKSAIEHFARQGAAESGPDSEKRMPSCIMEITLEPDDQSLENPFVERIAAFKPDLIVQISRMRYENPHLPPGVPFLSWDQDNLPCMRTPEATASLDELTFVAGHGALQGYLYQNWPAHNVILCHLAASTHRYRPRGLTPEEAARYGCDLSYVSNASGSPASLRDQHLSRFRGSPGNAAALFGALCEKILSDSCDSQGVPWNDSSLRAAAGQLALENRMTVAPNILQEIILAALLVADRAFRHETLQWVSEFCESEGKSLRIYGAGWEMHPHLARYAAGPASQGPEIQAITLASRINLQIIGTGVLHSRFLDGIAAGGFFLFRQTPNEQGEPQLLADLECVSRCVFVRTIESFAALDQVAEPAIANAWRAIRPAYLAQMKRTSLDERTTLRGMATAHQLRNPISLIPALDQIGFRSNREFAEKARAFLTDSDLRDRLAARLRESVQEHFSYDARWQSFLSHIRHALRQSSPTR
jgi:Glycosyl transferases group 1